uniref:Uncharacterized protein n=1 Tax=Oryza brachyantha TaxID=4533 RepID=J3NEL3_ORYBR
MLLLLNMYLPKFGGSITRYFLQFGYIIIHLHKRKKYQVLINLHQTKSNRFLFSPS